MSRQCKDCGPGGKRAAPHPGPRCATHHRAVIKARRARAHEQMVHRTYALPPGAYNVLVASQGGKCAICRRATGRAKRLAVDHDHKCCKGPVSCGRCVRGALCSVCNRLLAHVRDDPETLQRAAAYLMSPPALALMVKLVPKNDLAGPS